jgi:hypothetical protein
MLLDWITSFYPQIANPWTLQVGIFNLPWIYVVLHPLYYLGPIISAIIMQIAVIISIWYICDRLNLPILHRVFIYLSPPVIWGMIMGQFDGIILLSYFLPGWVAPIAVLIKPQISIGSIRNLKPISFLPAIILAISAYIIWKWPFSIQFPSVGGPFDDTFRGPLWNWSPWPFGLILLPILLFSKKISTRMGISPFLSPYIGVHSLIGPLIALATTNFWLFLLGWIFLWIRWWKMVNVGL